MSRDTDSSNEPSHVHELVAVATMPHPATREILGSFRNNYEKCASSGFFPAQTVLDVYQCAHSFRTLGVYSIEIARLASNTWISATVLNLYGENIGIFSNEERKELFRTLGPDTKKISKIFEVFEVWARNLSVQIYNAEREARATGVQFTGQLDTEINAAQRLLANVQSDLQNDAQIIFDAAQDRDRKAKELAKDTSTLVQALSYMEIVSHPIGGFWRILSYQFRSLGLKMIRIEATLDKGNLIGDFVPEDVLSWKQSKQQLDKYVEVMTEITNMFDYPSEASPALPPTKIQIPELNSYSMEVPSGVDVDSIMATDRS